MNGGMISFRPPCVRDHSQAAEEHFHYFAPMFEIGNEIDFSNRLYLIRENTERGSSE
jgi:hypothetical protein